MALPLFAVFFSCTQSDGVNFRITLREKAVKEVKLQGEASYKTNEYSGLAWWRDSLLLLPQYVFHKGNLAYGNFYLIGKSRLLSYLDGQDTSAIEVEKVPVNTEGLESFGRYGSGCEAIVFDKDTCYLSVEIGNYSSANAILIKGYFNGKEFVFDKGKEAEVKSQSGIPNISEEATTLTPDGIITIHEANGKNVNSSPVAHLFDKNLHLLATPSMPRIEYRITDLTALDSSNNFWAINYFYKGDAGDLNPAVDEIAKKYGVGSTHYEVKRVERLLQFHYSIEGITLCERGPIYLELDLNDDARNWEGIAELPGKGFFMITDTYPRTIFGFLSYEGN